MITNSTHIAMQVPDVDTAISHATSVMGLRVVEQADGRTFLTHGGQRSLHDVPHHVLELSEGSVNALDHLGFEVDDASALAELTARLDKHGVEIISDRPEEPGLAAAIRFFRSRRPRVRGQHHHGNGAAGVHDRPACAVVRARRSQDRWSHPRHCGVPN